MASKNQYVPIRMSDKLMSLINQHTNGEPRNRSRVIRIAIESGLRAENLEMLKQSIEATHRQADEVSQLRQDLARVGGNLNQLAMLFNMDRFDGSKLEELSDTHKELQQTFSAILDRFLIGKSN